MISANRLNTPYPVYPIGLDYVRGALPAHHEVKVLDLAVEDSNTALSDAVRSFEPELVGIALRNIDNTDAADSQAFVQDYRSLVRALRALTQAPVVLGGAAFTIAPRALLDTLGADYGILGEGERLADLIAALEAGGPVVGPGVVEGANTPAGVEPLPAPPRRALPETGPQLEHYLRNGAMLNLQTKRGCPYACIYCTYPHVEGKQLRLFDPAEVARTARGLQALGAKFLFVTDAVFNADEEHSLAVARALEAAGVTIPWGAYFSPRTTPDAYWRSLAQSGLSHVEFGTDSLSDEVLRRYRKPFDAQTVLTAHRAALGAGLHIAHFFVLGGPGETADTVRRTFEVAEQLERCVCFFFSGMRIFPGTRLFELVHEGNAEDFTDVLTPTFYQSDELTSEDLNVLAVKHAAGRSSWIIGSGGERISKILSRMYALGYTGPLWEKLIQ
ncbi:MAG: lipid biosynthesis B12-binding/radical SAM protein [bacterium]